MQLTWNVVPNPEEVIIQLDTSEKQQIQQGNIPEWLTKKHVLNLVSERPGFFIIKTGISDSNEALQRAVYEKYAFYWADLIPATEHFTM